MGYDPAISVVIEFPTDCARRAMEASQILCGLLENSGSQLSLARLGDVIFGRFHRADLVCPFLSQAFEERHFRKLEISFAIPGAVASINERKSTGRGCRAEHRETDS